MGPRFKYGDRVVVSGHSGKIKSIRKEDNKYICTVLFDNSALIPPEMDYEERYVKFENALEEACPACGGRWKVVKFNMKTWKDCLKCNKTQEQLVKEYYEKPKTPSKSDEDLLREFEKMLDNRIDQDDDDDDDDDDFGLFDIGV